jgi:hypothetical protein
MSDEANRPKWADVKKRLAERLTAAHKGIADALKVSDTPRTDAIEQGWLYTHDEKRKAIELLLEHARQLERENTLLRSAMPKPVYTAQELQAITSCAPWPQDGGVVGEVPAGRGFR